MKNTDMIKIPFLADTENNFGRHILMHLSELDLTEVVEGQGQPVLFLSQGESVHFGSNLFSSLLILIGYRPRP